MSDLSSAFILLAACGLLAVVGTVVINWRMRSIARQRAAYSVDMFCECLRSSGSSNEVCRAVFEYFAAPDGKYGVPPKPEDRISGLYGAEGEDFVELVDELIARLGRRVPPWMVGDPIDIDTVKELVQLLDSLPMAEQ